MSDISASPGYRASEPSSPAKSAALGLRSTLVWGALGFVAVMSTWLMGAIPRALGRAPIGLPPAVDLLPIGHMAAVAVVAAALWACGRSFRGYLALRPLRWRDVGRGIGYGLLGCVVMGVVAYLVGLLMWALGVGGSPSALPTPETPFNAQALPFLISIWVAMVIAGPIAEEILYRGLLYRGLAASRLGVLGTIVLTSVIFGLGHYPGFGWSRVVWTGFLGLLLGWVRWRTDSTSVSIVAHATTNLVGVTVLTAIVLSH
jgi:membrane protease YdiL (CAAX protease family)